MISSEPQLLVINATVNEAMGTKSQDHISTKEISSKNKTRNSILNAYTVINVKSEMIIFECNLCIVSLLFTL